MANDLLISTRAGKRKLRANLKDAAARGKRIIGESAPLWPAPYNSATFEARCRFVFECCWTLLENGQIWQIPDKEYVRWTIWHWHNTRETGKTLVVWKPRRMVTSWLCRCLELHDLGLYVSEHLLADEKMDKSEEHIWRYYFIYEQIRQRFKTWNLEPAQTFGSLDQKRLETMTLPNGSMFKRINSNPESLFGKGVRSVTLEEPHTYTALSDMISQARLITQGPIGGTNGHLVCIGNSAPREGWIRLLKRSSEQYRPQPGEYPAPMYSGVYLGDSGVRVLDLNYRSDPDKNDAWVAENRPGVLTWQADMEKSMDVQTGQPVFSMFDSTLHVPELYLTQSRRMDKHSMFILGIDTGINTMNHAAVLLEVTPGHQDSRRLIVVKEFVPKSGMMFQEFGRWCQDWILQNVPQGYHGETYWVADRSITTREGLTHMTIQKFAQRELRENIIPIGNAWEGRRASVEWALTDWAKSVTDRNEELPRLALVRKDCPELFRALLTGYCWRPPTNPSEGADLRRPDKNMSSHIADALQYAVLFAREQLRKQERQAVAYGPSTPEEAFDWYRSETTHNQGF